MAYTASVQCSVHMLVNCMKMYTCSNKICPADPYAECMRIVHSTSE
jgi:hypothetical protein